MVGRRGWLRETNHMACLNRGRCLQFDLCWSRLWSVAGEYEDYNTTSKGLKLFNKMKIIKTIE